MRNPDEFDAFYKDARGRLLLQTYALTGDLPASRAAVRDSYVVAWHHWRKVSRLDDREGWARPRAWRHAQRRHTARLWRRDTSLGDEGRATLDALGKLSVVQRKALLLTALARLPLDEMAREIGLPAEDAGRVLQDAVDRFAEHRGVEDIVVSQLFAPLRERVERARWPRPTIIRRAGAGRRRLHTTIGVLSVVAAVGLISPLVSDDASVRPTLAQERLTSATGDAAVAAHHDSTDLTEDLLLGAEQLDELLPGAWSVTTTSDNSDGDGLVLPCQQERYADPQGLAAIVRTFEAEPRRKRPDASAAEAGELSATPAAARRTFNTALAWYAGCTDPRVQLLTTRRVRMVGDKAVLFALRSWVKPPSTLVVGVARTGQVTVTTVFRTVSTQRADLHAGARVLAQAVNGVCGLPQADACAVAKPELQGIAPLSFGRYAGMLSEVDLPPVAGVSRAWVGTPPTRARTNVAATTCDRADFGDPMTNNMTRTFLIPKANLATKFGLTETVGSLPKRDAVAFIEQVRRRMAACAEKDLGSEVVRIAQLDNAKKDLSVWRVTTRITDDLTVTYLMGVARYGTSLAQVGFVPDGTARIEPAAFTKIVQRALDRLRDLPKPAL